MDRITINLADFFSDQDAGDSLRYTAVSNNENVVTTMIDGSMLRLTEVEGSGFGGRNHNRHRKRFGRARNCAEFQRPNSGTGDSASRDSKGVIIPAALCSTG